MNYYNKVLDGNIPLGIMELITNQNNYQFKDQYKDQYSYYQIKKNISNVSQSDDLDINNIMKSKWAPFVNKSVTLNRNKILAGITNILSNSLKIAIEKNKNEVIKIGLLSDSVQIQTIIKLVAKTFGEQFLLLIKAFKINNHLSDLHIKLVHLAGLTNLSNEEINNIATKIGLELELSTSFKINTILNVVYLLSNILTPEIIKSKAEVCRNNSFYDCLFNELYISELSEIILSIWESILENIITLSTYKHIINIYAFSIDFADALYLQSKIQNKNVNKNIEHFGQSFGNKTKIKNDKRTTDITNITDDIDQSKVISGAASLLSSAITNAVNKNSSDLLRTIAVSNNLSVKNAAGTSFIMKGIDQSSTISQQTDANFVQQTSNKVINDISNIINEQIDSASKQLSSDLKKALINENSGSSLENMVGTYTDIFKISAGNSTKSTTTEDNRKELIKNYKLKDTFNLDQNKDVNTQLNNILSTDNLSKCAANTTSTNSIDLNSINVTGPINISDITQNSIVNDVMKCAFTQTIITEIATKIINDYENNIKLMLENIDEKLDLTQSQKVQGDILAAGTAGAAICESVGIAGAKLIDSGGTASAKVIDSAGTAGSKVIDSTGTAGSKVIDSTGSAIGSVMGGMGLPLIIGLVLLGGYYLWSRTQDDGGGDGGGDGDGDGDGDGYGDGYGDGDGDGDNYK
jgi:hypothetical protein